MVILYRLGARYIKINNSCYKNPRLKFNGLKYYSLKAAPDVKPSTFVPFLDMLVKRKAQAAKSILVQVQSAKSYKELYSYCNSIGTVKDMFHYAEDPEKMHFIIVEFSDEADVKNILAASTHTQENQTVPVHSHFLWFRAANRKLGKLKQSKTATLSVENGTKIVSDEELISALNNGGSVSDQIKELYKLTRLNEVGIRLRFLTANQIESTISGLFPRVCAYPFGSSVNGFGKMGCDLDLVLRLSEDKENEESRLIYHCKSASWSERSTNQRNMEAISDLIHQFLPGCNQVRRILQARVPIIKYHQQLTNIDCDLSMTNMSGVFMSDFLYIMGELDERVRPLVFTIKKWAKDVHLTNSSPGRWITNFSLTLLTLAFLQRPLYSPPVLPTLNTLVKLAGPQDEYVTEDGINCTFLRNVETLNFKTQNDKSLEALLLEFFEFYCQFDFDKKAVCLNEAVSISKPEHCALYIINPLERGLNVSKNVSFEELEKFKIELRNAAWLLESQDTKSSNNSILPIFESKNLTKYKLNFPLSTKQNRLMEVSNLFDGPVDEETIKFKNASIEEEVHKIRKETKGIIKKIVIHQASNKSRR